MHEARKLAFLITIKWSTDMTAYENIFVAIAEKKEKVFYCIFTLLIILFFFSKHSSFGVTLDLF